MKTSLALCRGVRNNNIIYGKINGGDIAPLDPPLLHGPCEH